MITQLNNSKAFKVKIKLHLNSITLKMHNENKSLPNDIKYSSIRVIWRYIQDNTIPTINVKL